MVLKPTEKEEEYFAGWSLKEKRKSKRKRKDLKNFIL